MTIGWPAQIAAADGTRIAETVSITHLGSVIHASGRTNNELSRRIGMCGSIFKNMHQIWGHSRIVTRRKLDVFKLLYGLSPIWLGIAEQRRLDGFQCRCLWKISKIAVAYVSWVSN